MMSPQNVSNQSTFATSVDLIAIATPTSELLPGTNDPNFPPLSGVVNTTDSPYLETDDLDLVYCIISAIMLLSFVLAVIDIIHSQCSNRQDGLLRRIGINKSDQMNFLIIIIFGLRICDLITDIVLTYHMTAAHIQNPTQHMITYLYMSSIICILIPYLVNIITIYKVIKSNTNIKATTSWFSKHAIFFVIIVIITGDIFVSTSLISSNFLGLTIFDSGHSSIALASIQWIKLLTIAFEVLFYSNPHCIFSINVV